jgi:hypothetical protein
MSELGSGGSGKSVSQLHAERIAERMFTDMMASAGVPVNRMAMEVLYFMPRQFRDAYVSLFRKALRGDDSGVDESGRRNDSVGVLGKASGKNDSSGRQPNGEVRRTEFAPGQTAAISGRGKKFQRHWTIEDERAFQVKELIDKRLRGMAREIQDCLTEWEQADETLDGSGKDGSRRGKRETWEESKGLIGNDAQMDAKKQERLSKRIGSISKIAQDGKD